MTTPANDLFPDEAPAAPIGGPAKILGILLLVVQSVLIAAFLVLLGVVVSLTLFPADNAALEAEFMTPGGHMAIIFYALGSLVVMNAIVWHLRKLVKTLRLGDPFVPENALRLKYIWIIVAVGEAARTALQPFIARVNPAVELTWDVRPHVWFFILILLVLAQVFKEGARLRAEAQLTV